ncbi:MAG: hypothetical protein JSV10_07140 [Candidatus Zixiibacteriota bacterium]|nr:MAG: hypothetical protein JSV10_07140 [candidate division Zixibacteria bacterium]
MNVWLDQILGAVLSLIRLLLSSFSDLTQQVGDLAGPLGQLGLYLFLTLFGLWLTYQILRILSLIVVRILLPVAALLLTLFLLVVLIS